MTYDASADQPLPGTDALADRIAATEAVPVKISDVRAPRKIDISNESEAGRAIRRALLAGALPETYRRHGHVVVVDELEAMPRSRGGRHLIMGEVEPPALRRMLGEHTYTYRVKPVAKKDQVDGGPTTYESEALPTVQTCRDVLSARRWEGLPPLSGVTSSPILRPDGSLVQAPGYDQATGMYYAPALDVGRIPARPDQALVEQARSFVLDTVLGDFPWEDKADRANYLALLVAPILRSMDASLLPLGAVSAASAGTGKTLLAGDIFAALFGLTSRPWVPHDEEVRKAVSTVLLGSTKPVVLFDNVPEWQSIASPILAKLLTSSQWDDRALGTMDAVDVENDRLWLATGNSMSFGGDMPSRTVLVRLDAKMARPDLRDPAEFKIPNLQAWLTDPGHAAEFLRNLLIMIADWVAHDRPRGNYVMRQFTSWARNAGGFLDHHGVHGFLGNADALSDVDDEMTAWLAFCHEWHSQFGTDWKTPTEVARSTQTMFDPMGGSVFDPWQGHYLVDSHGRPVSAVGLGKRLGGKVGRIFGGDVHGYRIEKLVNSRTGQSRYRVIRAADVDKIPDGKASDSSAPVPAAVAAPRQMGLWQPSEADDDD